MERASSGGRATARPTLRTYGKRTTSGVGSEPASKKRNEKGVGVSGNGGLSRRTESTSVPSLQSQPQLPLPLPTSRQPKKGSILSYFKVTSPSSGAASPCAQSSQPTLPSSTPPPSPPPTFSQKKRRRLTTKPSRRIESSPEEDALDTDEIQGTYSGLDAPHQELEKGEVAMRAVTISTINRQTNREEDRSDTGKRDATKKQKSKPATVQTTLSLSLMEKQFVECEDCHMLYNPYHEKDVKLHARRHAALLKATKSTAGVEI